MKVSKKETAAAQKMVAEFHKQIEGAPALMSLLYDIDLMPEQIILRVNAVRMAAFCMMFAKLTPEAIEGLFEKT